MSKFILSAQRKKVEFQTLPFLYTDTLEEKVNSAKAFLLNAYIENEGKLFLSFSGGKDSTILRHIALQMFPDIPVVFSNTTNELAEVLRYVKTFPDVITVVPKMSFKDVVKTHGFPLISKEVSQKVSELKHINTKHTRMTRFRGDHKGNGKLSTKWRFVAEQEFDVTHKCCKILKKDPLEKWGKAHGLKPVIALMSDESNLRQQLSLYGDHTKKIYPFLTTGWTEEDIWAYAKLHNIRFAECYYDRVVNGALIKARKRTGCEYCGFGITLEKEDRFERSRLTSPKRFQKMMLLENNGITFQEAISVVKAENPKPVLDLYGVKYKGITHHHDQQWRIYDVDATTTHKKCPHCSSKKIKKTRFKGLGNYFDSPHPQTGEKRTVFANTTEYECNSCGQHFLSDLHMFEADFGVTLRFVEYMRDNLATKSSSDIMKETGADFDTVYNIMKNHPLLLEEFSRLSAI